MTRKQQCVLMVAFFLSTLLVGLAPVRANQDGGRSKWGVQLRSPLDPLDYELQGQPLNQIKNPVRQAIEPLFVGTEQYFHRDDGKFKRLYLSQSLSKLKERVQVFESSQIGNSVEKSQLARLEFIEQLRQDSSIQELVNAVFLGTTKKIADLYPLSLNDYHYFDRAFDLLESLRAAPHFEINQDGIFENPKAYLGSEYVDILESFYRSRIPTPEQILRNFAPQFESVKEETYRQEVVGKSHFLGDLKLMPKNFRSDLIQKNYVNPTEHNPGAAAAILKTAPMGAYVTVGTERGFIGAGQTPNATHLVFLDVSRGATIYNRINIALLQMAKNRQDYLWLRRQATHEDVLLRLAATPPDEQGLSLLRRQKVWEWWSGQTSRDGFVLLHEPPDSSLKDHAFKDANYLHYDDQFQRVSQMAKNGRIASLQIDLADMNSVQAFTQAMIEQEVRLSVFDLSDVWYDSDAERFLVTNKTVELLKILSAAAQNSSVLLLTSWHSKVYSGVDRRSAVIKEFNERIAAQTFGRKIPIKEGSFWPWIYFGYTFEALAKQGGAGSLITNLNIDFRKSGRVNPKLAGTLDGRLPFPEPSRFAKFISFFKVPAATSIRRCHGVLN